MEYIGRKIRSPLKMFGGKSYLCRRFIDLFPPHSIYVEPFAGGLSILLNKMPSRVEVAGDVNSDLIEFWREMQESPFNNKVMMHVRDLAYTESVFENAKSVKRYSDKGAFAAAFLIVNRFSRGGLGKDFAWSERLRGKTQPGGPIPGDANAWNTIRADLPRVCARLQNVRFYCKPAIDLMTEYDSRDTLHYCDPPYLHETRTTRDAYDHEMSCADHENLLIFLLGCRGKVFLSGYANPLYDTTLAGAGWKRHEFSVPNHSGQTKTKSRRLECLWENPPHAPARLG